MGLGDVARTKYHARNAFLGQNRSVAKVIDAHRAGLAEVFHELPDKRQFGARFHGRARGLFHRGET